jgi:gliding motility-associated transport system ATP-binding protein
MTRSWRRQIADMIDCKGLTKQYGPLRAIDDLSFSVGPGQVLGFLGPNGAGKTTTMRIIAGFLVPTSGQVTVCGYDVENQPIEARRKIGYLPEGAPAYPEMTPLSFLRFVADVREMRGSWRDQRLDEVIGLLHLESVLHQSIDTLSKGFKRRVGLAQAILHDPEVLILDEPTDGLDPNQKYDVRQLISGMAANKIVVISTHVLEEVDAVCNRALIIAKGRILADDTPAGLESKSRFHNAVTIKLRDFGQLKTVNTAVAKLNEVASTEVDIQAGKLTAFPAPNQLPLTAISELAARQKWDLAELHLESGRLDEVFRTVTGGASA